MRSEQRDAGKKPQPDETTPQPAQPEPGHPGQPDSQLPVPAPRNVTASPDSPGPGRPAGTR